MIFLCCVFASLFVTRVDSNCQFPDDLRGFSWYTTSNGIVSIPEDGGTIHNFNSAVIQSSPLIITCSEYDNDTNRYIGSSQFTVFGTDSKVFYCMRFTKITSTKYVLTYESEFDSTTQKRLVVINNSTGTLTPSEVCTLTTALPTGTHELVIRTDSLASAVITCPAAISVTLSATIQSAGCSGNSISGDVSSTQHTYTYDSCVTTKYSAGGVFDCMYSVSDDQYTYLNVYNRDSTADGSTTYRFLCYVMWSSGQVVYYTYHPEICQVSQTPTEPTTDGVAVVAYNHALSNDIGSQITVGVIFGLLWISLVIITVILLVLYINPKCIQRKEQGKEELTRKIKQNKTKSSKGTSKREKKKRKKKQDKNIDQNQNLTFRRTESMKDTERKLKWTDFVGISANVTDYVKPTWQQKWEQHQDPLWGKTIVVDEDLESARSEHSVASTTKIIMVTPEKEEQAKANSLWDSVYRLWYEPRKPIPENRLENQKLSKLAQPKHVRFKWADKSKS